MQVSMYVNGQFLLPFLEDIANSATVGRCLGLGARTGTATFTRFEVDAFSDEIPFSSVSPNQPIMQPVNTILQNRPILLRNRFDGSVIVEQDTPGTSVFTFAESDLFDIQLDPVDRRRLLSHFRLNGMFKHADVLDSRILGLIGHRYGDGYAPHIEDEDRLWEEALVQISLINRQAVPLEISGPANPLLEKGDVVTTPYGDFEIRRITFRDGGSGTLQMSLFCIAADLSEVLPYTVPTEAP
jgi:hypothetical protein